MYSYFNECLPPNQVLEQYVVALQDTALAYVSLKKQHKNLDGIVTSVELNSMLMSNKGISLGDCIKKIENQDVRRFICSWLINYPVREYLDETINEDDLIEQSYTLSIGGTDYPATNLAIAYYNGIFLFTLGIHEDLRKNELTLVGAGDKSLSVCNLFSQQPENVTFVEQFIIDAENSTLSITEQIDKLFGGRVKRTKSYCQTFSKLATSNQQAILDRLKRAKELKLLDFKVDDDIFRHTRGFDKKENFYGPVYELRIREPKEIRIYFQYVDNVYYVLSMGGKGNDQNTDIAQAFDRIKQIRQL